MMVAKLSMFNDERRWSNSSLGTSSLRAASVSKSLSVMHHTCVTCAKSVMACSTVLALRGVSTMHATAPESLRIQCTWSADEES